MKICKTELLLLGGVYQFLVMMLGLFNNEISYTLGGILYILFWVMVLALSMSFINSINFVYKINDSFPKISVFLASIGWIPYFSVIYALISALTDYMYNGTDQLTIFLNNYMPVYDVYMALITLSLLYAFYKVFFQKQDLKMSCYNLNPKM